MLKRVLLLFILAFSGFVQAEESYLPADEFYQKHQSDYPNWQLLRVPLYYDTNSSADAGQANVSHQDSATTISYHVSENFDSQKPTIVFINGGPGGSSLTRTLDYLEGFNRIHFNQRGVAFSLPDLEETLTGDSKYFSSRNTAQDILQILNHLKVKKATIYGHSYGTVSATIFGSLFPDRTEKVILEGTIYDGEPTLWSAPHRFKLLQKFFDQLDPESKNIILKVNARDDVNKTWFHTLLQQMMYSADFDKNFLYVFRFTLSQRPEGLTDEENEKRIAVLLNNMAQSTHPSEVGSTMQYSARMFQVISCLELSGSDNASTFLAELIDGKLKTKLNEKQYCENVDLNLQKTYRATDYPLQVPVYYFQGVWDGATTADAAIRHYKNVALGPATLILAKQEGHAPMISAVNPYIMDENPVRLAKVAVLKKILLNQDFDLHDINQNLDKKHQWVMTSKKR